MKPSLLKPHEFNKVDAHPGFYASEAVFEGEESDAFVEI